jgi:hypothetical protein
MSSRWPSDACGLPNRSAAKLAVATAPRSTSPAPKVLPISGGTASTSKNLGVTNQTLVISARPPPRTPISPPQ